MLGPVVFRVDASASIGLGHLMRCLGLAQAFAAEDIEVIFAIDEETLPHCRQRHDWVGKVKVVQGQNANNAEWLSAFAIAQRAFCLVLDGYHFDAKYRQQLCQHPYLFAVIDDNNDSGDLYADVVINHNPHAQSLDYANTAPNATLLLGDDFRLLRQEFLQDHPRTWTEREGLVLCFGGADSHNLSLALLEALEKLDADMPIRLLTGSAYQHAEALKQWLKTTTLLVQHLHNWQQVADAFGCARLAVVAAGGSQYECLATHTPTILVTTANNQLGATSRSAKGGWCEWINSTNDAPRQAASVALKLYQQPDKLMQMHLAAKANKVGSGTQQVVDTLIRLSHKKQTC